MKSLFTSVFLLCTSYLFCQLPDTDIWLLDIKGGADNISIVNPVNITHHKGYDNQPVFSPDGKYILYSSQVDGTQQTDIYKYDLATKTSVPFIKTPGTSEYSPEYTPDGKNVSVLMVEKDSAQRVWKFRATDGGDPICMIPGIKDIGYYCWVNKDSIAAYVLTKPSNTLQLINLLTQKTTVVNDSIGRCMRMRDNLLWYTTKLGIANNVFEYQPQSKMSVFQGVIEGEDYCFYNENIWSCSGNTIVSGYMSSRVGALEIIDLSKYGITHISRITISPDGKKMAVVANANQQ